MALYDVVVVGGGNAAFCAAHAAREYAERVLIVEKAPPERAGVSALPTMGWLNCAPSCPT
jgi:tricarballylate dehydrogenase